jgi:hypothetical protein
MVHKRLLAYGVNNVYEMDGKAYYQDAKDPKKFIRAPERDNLIKKGKKRI